MKIIKWLLSLAETKPLIFSIAILLVAIGISMSLIRYQERKNIECQKRSEFYQDLLKNKTDSFNTALRGMEERHTKETREILNSIIEDYKGRLETQEKVNQEVREVLSSSNRVIRRTQSKIKNLER